MTITILRYEIDCKGSNIPEYNNYSVSLSWDKHEKWCVRAGADVVEYGPSYNSTYNPTLDHALKIYKKQVKRATEITGKTGEEWKSDKFDEYAEASKKDAAEEKARKEIKLESGGDVAAAERNKAIAMTILQQLGGMNRLNIMTGAYNFLIVNSGVSFKIKNPRGNYIKITLTSKDLYNLEIGRIRGDKYTVVYEGEGLYNDQLKPIIEEKTGMYLSLEEGGEISSMTEKDVLKKYFGANIYPQEITDNFLIESKSISDDDRAEKYIQDLKSKGFTVKSKSYSEFTSITGVKRKDKNNAGTGDKTQALPPHQRYTTEYGKRVSGYQSLTEKALGEYSNCPVVYFVDDGISNSYIVCSGILYEGEIINGTEAFDDWFGNEADALNVAYDMSIGKNVSEGGNMGYKSGGMLRAAAGMAMNVAADSDVLEGLPMPVPFSYDEFIELKPDLDRYYADDKEGTIYKPYFDTTKSRVYYTKGGRKSDKRIGMHAAYKHYLWQQYGFHISDDDVLSEVYKSKHRFYESGGDMMASGGAVEKEIRFILSPVYVDTDIIPHLPHNDWAKIKEPICTFDNAINEAQLLLNSNDKYVKVNVYNFTQSGVWGASKKLATVQRSGVYKYYSNTKNSPIDISLPYYTSDRGGVIERVTIVSHVPKPITGSGKYRHEYVIAFSDGETRQIEQYQLYTSADAFPRYESGGEIDGYGDKTVPEVWNDWTPRQRKHFVKDHIQLLYGMNGENEPFLDLIHNCTYQEAKEMLANDRVLLSAIANHMSEGQYADGGEMTSALDADFWKKLSLLWRTEHIKYKNGKWVNSGMYKNISNNVSGLELTDEADADPIVFLANENNVAVDDIKVHNPDFKSFEIYKAKFGLGNKPDRPGYAGTGRNISVFDYGTENFDMSADAVILFEKMQQREKVDKFYVENAAKEFDFFLGIEKKCVETGKATDKQFSSAMSSALMATTLLEKSGGYEYLDAFPIVTVHLREIARCMPKSLRDGGAIVKQNILHIGKNVADLDAMIDEDADLEAWVEARIARANIDISDVTNYLGYQFTMGDGIGGDGKRKFKTSYLDIANTDDSDGAESVIRENIVVAITPVEAREIVQTDLGDTGIVTDVEEMEGEPAAEDYSYIEDDVEKAYELEHEEMARGGLIEKETSYLPAVIADRVAYELVEEKYPDVPLDEKTASYAEKLVNYLYKTAQAKYKDETSSLKHSIGRGSERGLDRFYSIMHAWGELWMVKNPFNVNVNVNVPAKQEAMVAVEEMAKGGVIERETSLNPAEIADIVANDLVNTQYSERLYDAVNKRNYYAPLSNDKIDYAKRLVRYLYKTAQTSYQDPASTLKRMINAGTESGIDHLYGLMYAWGRQWMEKHPFEATAGSAVMAAGGALVLDMPIFHDVMEEFKEGALKDRWGNVVKKKGQALAIAFSKSRSVGNTLNHEAGGIIIDGWEKQKEWKGNPAIGFDSWMKKFTVKNNPSGRPIPVYIFGSEKEITYNFKIGEEDDTIIYKPGWNFCVSAGANSDYSYSGSFPDDIKTIEQAIAFIEAKNKEQKLIYEAGGAIANKGDKLFNFNSFTLAELKEYLRKKTGDGMAGEISINFLATGHEDKYENRIKDYYEKKSLMYEKKFSIGDIGKQVTVEKGSENIYLDLSVYDNENKAYLIGLYSKENHQGLKQIAGEIIAQFKSGGQIEKKYKLGDKWSEDFDYDGMVNQGLLAGVNWSIKDLKLLHQSFESVNYHNHAKLLDLAIKAMEKGDTALAKNHFKALHETLTYDAGDVDYELELEAVPNPDNSRKIHSGIVKIKKHRVPVSSFSDARIKVASFIEDNDLGGGNFVPAKIYLGDVEIGYISYNGRLWNPDGTAMAMGDGGIIAIDKLRSKSKEGLVKMYQDMSGLPAAHHDVDTLIAALHYNKRIKNLTDEEKACVKMPAPVADSSVTVAAPAKEKKKANTRKKK